MDKMSQVDLVSEELNEATWAFINAMPYSIPGPIFNDLKPALKAAIDRYLALPASPNISASRTLLTAAKRLEARGFFAPSSCADAETAEDMAAMRKAIEAWPHDANTVGLDWQPIETAPKDIHIIDHRPTAIAAAGLTAPKGFDAASLIVRDVAELDYSDGGFAEEKMMAVTADDLRRIIERHIAVRPIARSTGGQNG